MKKAFDIAGNVAMWLFLLFAVTVTVFMFSSSSSEDGYPTLFGRVFIPVEAEVDIEGVNSGDLIIVKEKEEDTLFTAEAGNILVFTQKSDSDGKDVLKLDRIKETRILKDGNVEIKFEKAGTVIADRKQGALKEARFIAKFDGKKVPAVGAAFGFLVSSTGFVSIVIIPLVLLFLFELFNYVIAVMRRPRSGISDAERRAIEEQAVADYIKRTENM